MNDKYLDAGVAQAAMEHVNRAYASSLAAFARTLEDAAWTQEAALTAVDAAGFELLLQDGNGRQESRRVAFPQPVQDADELRAAFVTLAQETGEGDSAPRSASARVETPKASRYLKALCNHFDRKASARYDDNDGSVAFPFGDAEFHADDKALHIMVTARGEAMFARVKFVVADHLLRFGEKEGLQVDWVETNA